MPDEVSVCPNCGTKIKSSLLSSVVLYTDRATTLINEYTKQSKDGYCTKCGEKIYQESMASALQELATITKEVNQLIDLIPIISLQAPAGWDYKVIRMVTAQSTMGTGFLTEISSSFSDLLGNQSSAYNEKIKVAETNCFNQLRALAINHDANAIIGTDIDYAEMGGGKNMVMVSMAGTAIKLKNSEVISDEFEQCMDELTTKRKRLAYLKPLTVQA